MRRKRNAFGLKSQSKKDTMEVAGLVSRITEAENPASVFIDVGGIGAGVEDRLRELGHTRVVEAMNSSEKALDSSK